MSGLVAPYFFPGSARVIRLIVVQSILRLRTPSELSTLRPRSAVLFWSTILWFESACASEPEGFGGLCTRQKYNTCPGEHALRGAGRLWLRISTRSGVAWALYP